MKNIGKADRWVRLVLGIVLGVVAWYWLTGWVMWVVYILGAWLVIEAALGWCVFYRLMGINTHKPKMPAPYVPPQMPGGSAM